jgi:hypothetical protein
MTVTDYTHPFLSVWTNRTLIKIHAVCLPLLRLQICDFGLARIVDSTTMSAQQEDESGDLLRRPTTFAVPPVSSIPFMAGSLLTCVFVSFSWILDACLT